MKRFPVVILIVVVAAAWTVPAWAWGPRAQTAIVNTALHLISREQNLPLTQLQADVRAGAEISPIAMEELYPDMQTDPLRAVENEMALLTAARGGRIDAYFAWRLGVLGKLVGRITAPMATVDPSIRTQYYTDAEKAVDSGALKPEPRKKMEAMDQLERIIQEANSGNDLIASEYAGGTGFQGAAAARMAVDVSRSVNTVADVWWTIISSGTVPGNISEGQLQRYVLSAYAYYINKDGTGELDAAEASYRKMVGYTPEMSAQIGDLFYAAGLRERAIKEYESAVASAPERRDIVEKIGNFHSDSAEESLEKGLLEEALAGFERALATNLLHPTAEQRRLEVAAMIQKRDEQQMQYQATLKQAGDLRQLAEEEAAKNRFAEAMALLKQSEEAFKAVGDEFPAEAQLRTRGLREVQTRTAELQQGLLNNTMVFSGVGFAPDVNTMIADGIKGLDMETLQTLLRLKYEAEIQRLDTQMQSVVAIQ